MTITTRDQLKKAAGREYTIVQINKATLTNVAYASLFRVNTLPAQGAAPTTAALCDKSLTGAFSFPDQTSPKETYFYEAWFTNQNSNAIVEIHDRIAHMGGLNMTVTTAQTADVDLHSSGLNPAANRLGDSNFSDIMWWLECYSQGGGSAVNAALAVTYDDGSTGTVIVPVPATLRVGAVLPVNGYISAADAGKYIRSVDTVTLSATTGSAGNLGVTASRARTQLPTEDASETCYFDATAMGCVSVVNESCLYVIYRTLASGTGILNGLLKMVHG